MTLEKEISSKNTSENLEKKSRNQWGAAAAEEFADGNVWNIYG